METVYLTCAVTVTVVVIVMAVYLVLTLNQLRATARQAEEVLHSINNELATVNKVTGFVSTMMERFSTPWFKIGSWVAATVTSYIMSRVHKPPTPETGRKEQRKEQCYASEGGKHV